MSDNKVAAPAATPAPSTPVETTTENTPEIDLNAQGEQTEAEAKAEDSPVDEKASEGKETKKQKEVKKALRKLKLKVDSKEIEEELPFDLPEDAKAVEYLKQHLQLSKMAHNRANAHSQLEKDVKEFITMLRTNPEKVLTDPNIGVDLKQLAAKVIEQEIENSKKTPEQLEREKLENELKSIREEREKEKQDYQQKQFELLQQQEFERYDRLISDTLEKSDLPKSPYVVKKMAEYMLIALENNVEVEPKDILPLVREEIQNDVKAMFQVMPEDVIEGMVGKETINKLRKKAVAKAKPPTPVGKSIPDTGISSKKEDKPQAKQSYKDFFRRI